MSKHNQTLSQLLQVLFLTILTLQGTNIKKKPILESLQLVKLKLFHKSLNNYHPETYHFIVKSTKKNIKPRLLLKLLFFADFTDKLDQSNSKRAIINNFKRLQLLYSRHILSATDYGFTKSSSYINTLTLVSLYTIYKLRYDLNKYDK